MSTSQIPAPQEATRSWAGSAYPVSDDLLPLQRIYHWEKARAQEIFLTQPIQGVARDWTWAQAVGEARRMAQWLIQQNWKPGSHVVILSKNCAWWLMADMAIWMAGHVSVPIYASLTAPSVRSLLEHCDPVACFVGVIEDRSVLKEGIPAGLPRVVFPIAHDPEATSWDSIVQSTPPLASNPVRGADEIATIMYTSGTTGAPKGAMHCFRSFACWASAVTRVTGSRPDERMLSYLPLAHIAERALVEAAAFQTGFRLFFVENLDTFRTDLKRARPTVFFSVPRLFFKFQHGVLAKIPQRKLDRLLGLPLIGRIVKKKILKELGLDTARIAASGSAALPLTTLHWFRKLGLHLVEGYGMTETGITHTPFQGRSHPGYVGDGAPGVETKIAENGEVLVRSPMNMLGYYKNPEATREAFTEDGFFKTGDLGELDKDGWLKIGGRVKEQFKTSKGKYVSPVVIEKLLSVHPAVEGCCVMGSNMPQPFAILVMTHKVEEIALNGARKQAVEEEMRRLLSQVNAQLEPHERLQFLVISDQPWTVNNGYLTPTMKLKRAVLEQAHAGKFETWYEQGKPVIWDLTEITDVEGAG